MSDLEHNAAYWRAKAEEARATADSLQSETAREHMRSCAESYDHLAEMADASQERAARKVANDKG